MQGGMMFCCAEMRCWCNDVCAMRKMMCHCVAMEGESSQGELFAKLQASSPSQSSRAARCQLSQRESPWHDGKVSGQTITLSGFARGSLFEGAVAQRLRGFQSAEHKKSFSEATWIFCMEPNSFGVTRGEQPLVRASRASKVAGTFLVLFWCAKENLTPRNSALYLYYTPNPPNFCDQVPKASIFRPSATLQGRASVLYFL